MVPRRILLIVLLALAAFGGWRGARTWRRLRALGDAPEKTNLGAAIARVGDDGTAWVTLMDARLDCLGRLRGTTYVPLARRTALPRVVARLAERADCDALDAARSLTGVLEPAPRGVRRDLEAAGVRVDARMLLLCLDCTPAADRTAAIGWSVGAACALVIAAFALITGKSRAARAARIRL